LEKVEELKKGLCFIDLSDVVAGRVSDSEGVLSVVVWMIHAL